MLLTDLLLSAAATVVALSLRHDLDIPSDRALAALPYLGYTLAFAFLAIIAFGQHRSIWRMSATQDYRRVIAVSLATVAGASAVELFVDRFEGVARSLPLLQFVCMVSLMVGARAITRKSRELRSLRKRAMGALAPPVAAARTTVLIVGLNKLAELYVQAVTELSGGRIEIAGILGRSRRQVGRQARTLRILGLPEDLASVLRDLEIEGVSVDRIVVAMPMEKLSVRAREALAEVSRKTAISLQVLTDGISLGDDAIDFWRTNNLRALEFTTRELDLIRDRSYLRLKRAIDLVCSVGLLIITLPILTLVAAMVACDVGFPILFCQRRPGRWGRAFRVYKFRTMADAYNGDGRRIADVDRCSWIGKLLRRTRLDELPQLYNVAIGDMSFVGPRPLLPVDQSPAFKARLLVRPGITGYAQVQGGRAISAADKAAMDVWYVRNASLALDLFILGRTIPMVFFGERVNRSAIERAWSDLAGTGICSAWVRPGAESQSVAVLDRLPRNAA